MYSIKITVFPAKNVLLLVSGRKIIHKTVVSDVWKWNKSIDVLSQELVASMLFLQENILKNDNQTTLL